MTWYSKILFIFFFLLLSLEQCDRLTDHQSKINKWNVCEFIKTKQNKTKKQIMNKNYRMIAYMWVIIDWNKVKWDRKWACPVFNLSAIYPTIIYCLNPKFPKKNAINSSTSYKSTQLMIEFSEFAFHANCTTPKCSNRK